MGNSKDWRFFFAAGRIGMMLDLFLCTGIAEENAITPYLLPPSLPSSLLADRTERVVNNVSQNHNQLSNLRQTKKSQKAKSFWGRKKLEEDQKTRKI